MTGTDYHPLLAVLASGPESGILPLTWQGARVDSLLRVALVQGQLAGLTEETLLEGKPVNQVKIGGGVSYTPFFPMHVSLCTCAGREERTWERKSKLHPTPIERNNCSLYPVGSDGLRREREDRERPRSRARDSSRQRRDASPSRRERELDRDRDDHRKRDGRDRDVDRETNDDPRRWRDDGKREERMATRREHRDKEYRERERDRERDKERGSRVSERDPNWDSDRPRDRERDRWVMDERDSRSKRTNGRDRRGHSRDEDRDERKEPRVRVEEKEPAWMDTYIPNESGAGIFGGKPENGELDGIQAWKLDMKEKERKERESEVLRSSSDAELAEITEAQIIPPTEPPLDEIQLFKLMIKREEEKNKAVSLKGSVTDPAVAYIISGTDSGVSRARIAFAHS